MDRHTSTLGALSEEIARTRQLLARAREEAEAAREAVADARLRLLIAETPIADVQHQRAARALAGRTEVVQALEARLRLLEEDHLARGRGKPDRRRVRRTA